jgi:hypothetical protein
MRCHAMGFVCHNYLLYEIRLPWLEKILAAARSRVESSHRLALDFPLETLSKIDTESQNRMHKGAF